MYQNIYRYFVGKRSQGLVLDRSPLKGVAVGQPLLRMTTSGHVVEYRDGNTMVGKLGIVVTREVVIMLVNLDLANPYGFSVRQRMMLLPPIVAALEELGLEVWEPFARNNQMDFLETGWAYRIGQRDFEDVATADAIFAVVNGVPPEEGVMVELGMAIALGKPTFLLRDDFRRVVDSEQYPLNLMLFTGLPEEGWQDYFYTSVEEITSPYKALARWAMDAEAVSQ